MAACTKRSQRYQKSVQMLHFAYEQRKFIDKGDLWRRKNKTRRGKENPKATKADKSQRRKSEPKIRERAAQNRDARPWQRAIGEHEDPHPPKKKNNEIKRHKKPHQPRRDRKSNRNERKKHTHTNPRHDIPPLKARRTCRSSPCATGHDCWAPPCALH